jgi:cytoskeletal protein RodZ
MADKPDQDSQDQTPGQVIAPEGSKVESAPPKKLRKFKLSKWLIIIVMVLAAAGLLVWQIPLLKTQGAVRVANKFISEVKDKDVDSAYALTTGSYQAKQSKDELSKAVNSEIFAKFGGSDGQIESRKIVAENPKKAEIVYLYEINNRPFRLKITVVKEDKDWKIEEAGLDTVRALESTQPGPPGQ